MAIVCLFGSGAAVTIPVGCGDAHSPFVIGGVTPDQAYTDGPVLLRIEGSATRPALRVDVDRGSVTADLASVKMTLVPDIADGRARVRLDVVEWDGANFAFWVEARTGLAAGLYNLEFVDAHGRTSRLPAAFLGLGPDPAPPLITVDALTAMPYVASGADIMAEVVADDGLGGIDRIHWETAGGQQGDCPGPVPPKRGRTPPRRMTCPVSFRAPPVPPPGDPSVLPFTFEAKAWDVAGHQATLTIPLFAAQRPVIIDFSDTVGSLGGFQPFSVRGRFFLEGSQAFIAGVPIFGAVSGGDRRGDGSIVGWTPPHSRAESVLVEVRSPVGRDIAGVPFRYIAPPRPREVQPPTGPAGGGIKVTVRGNNLRTGVIILIGATAETRRPLYNVSYDAENKVVGCLPPGSGLASIWAYDPITGDGELRGAFTFKDPGAGPTPPNDPACL